MRERPGEHQRVSAEAGTPREEMAEIRDCPKAGAFSGCVPHLPELIQDGRILICDLLYGGNCEELIK